MIELEHLCKKEPRLGIFFDRVIADQHASLDALPVYKNAMQTMVGWYASSTDRVLQSSEAWDVAYHQLIEILEGEG